MPSARGSFVAAPTARPQQRPHPTLQPAQQRLPQTELPPRDEGPQEKLLPDGEDSEEPERQHDFWRWTAGVGWALDALLLGWAIFLRDLGFVAKSGTATVDKSYLDASNLGLGGATLKIDEATYADLLERELLEERSITESDSQLGRLLEKLKSDLAQFGARMRGRSAASEESASASEDEVAAKLNTLEAKVDANRLLLQRRDNVFLGELEGKLETLRSLSARLQRKYRVIETQGYTSEVPQPDSSMNGNLELVQFMQGSALPVAFVLAASAAIAWLSQQFLRVATAWRRREWSKAERARKVQLWRLRQLQDHGGRFMNELGSGKLAKAQGDFGELVGALGKWAAEPTWEELFRTEAAAFWERWGPQAFELEAVLPGVREAPQEFEPAAKWVADRWWASAQGVVKDTVEAALASWAGGGTKSEAASKKQTVQDGARQVEVGSKVGSSQAHSTGLVIRIFGRWPKALEWVSITNLPLAGDWREKALRLLIPAEKDVRDLPILGPLCESLLTAVVSNQVKRSVTTSIWGGLTTDLWRFRGSQKQFEMGYEVVEVNSQVPEKMCEIARSLPRSGTPGCVVRIHGLAPELEEPET